MTNQPNQPRGFNKQVDNVNRSKLTHQRGIKSSDVLDLRSTKKTNSDPSSSPKKKESRVVNSNHLQTQTQFQTDKSSYRHIAKTHPTAPLVYRAPLSAVQKSNIQPKTSSQSNIAHIDFFSFVVLRAFMPKANLILWQISLLRAIFSPQTWLLLTLPIIFLQISQYWHITASEILQNIKAFITPDHLDTLIISVGVALALFMLSLICRSMISAAGVHIRLREIDNRQTSLMVALRSAANTILRQCLNYLYHLVVLLAITSLSFFAIKHILSANISLIVISKFQLMVAVLIIWLLLLVMLYAKHWLQIGLFAKSSTTSHIQLQSFRLLFGSGLQNIAASLIGLGFLSLGYGVVFVISWYMVVYFSSQTTAPLPLILVLSSTLIVLLIGFVQYLQQNLWARQYFFAASNSTNAKQLLYMKRQKPESLAPLFVVLGVCIAILVAYCLLLWHFAPQIRGFMANWHAEIPDSIKLIIPIKQ